jgi:hypothetical protein
VFLRASVIGTPRCGDPHQRLSALRPLMLEGKEKKRKAGSTRSRATAGTAKRWLLKSEYGNRKQKN